MSLDFTAMMLPIGALLLGLLAVTTAAIAAAAVHDRAAARG